MNAPTPSPTPGAGLSLHRVRQPIAAQCRVRATAPGLVRVLMASALYAGFFGASLITAHLGWKLLWATLAGGFIGSMFILGHDASHNALTPHRGLNRWLARWLFLPAWHPNESWQLEHNLMHHTWTNVASMDPCYAPLDPLEYRALPGWKRAWLRLRQRFAFMGLWYLQYWWQWLIRVPAGRAIGHWRREVHRAECVALLAFAGLQLGLAWWLAPAGQSPWVNVGLCIVWPFYVWNWSMAFVTIQHHTHPRIHWVRDVDQWSAAESQLAGTLRVVYPRWVEEHLLHNITLHTAHHVDMRVPLYHLPRAQADLEQAFAQQVVVEPASLRGFVDRLSSCCLYDYQARRWVRWREVEGSAQ